ncbi:MULTISPECIES: TonB-dependent siderophore receptor [unclassified Pseudomonas]|jgi:iron complex outermembrane receptor protein|uniref:TonB-denpendent receptor n=1 Tax=Pseudomonas gorinensis TaxID=3240790 RepID=A0ACA7P8U9_9PSED|nr:MULTISPECIES: TonB-dependent siderophore receptor [unclassified Pseudomonas]AHC36393.1 TonB-denpendent receptor [Pseudomonas sp. TKP]MBL1311358.1 TonB-dependent siderophore receptor [Pseudomonas sp.]PMX10808.1 TonB-dependent siderophore receptor [Pseudomonas sp. MPBC4-3]PMX41228.1 TonB-dependent siderophore receptor [Pseudomonas sp. FW301-21B01]PMY03705.1 TonB-dependent siderophore receptor [Pseudomonas sp. MPR-R5A]
MVLRFRPVVTSRFALGLLLSGGIGNSLAAEIELPAVNVQGQDESGYRSETAAVGGFSEAPLLDTPASITVINAALIKDQQARLLSEVLRNDASVGDSYAPIGYYENFVVRGFSLNAASSYKINGRTITGEQNVALENKQQVEVLKGLAGLQSGISEPSGVINYVTKRPEDVRSVTVSTDDRGSGYLATDVGGWFGSEQQLGLRANVAHEDLNSYVEHADGQRDFVSLAFDWNISPDAVLQLDAEYQNKQQRSVPGYQLLGGTQVPHDASPKKLLGHQTGSKQVGIDSLNLNGTFEYRFSDQWKGSVSAARSKVVIDDYSSFAWGGATTGLGNYFTPEGNYDVYDYRSPDDTRRDDEVQAAMTGMFDTAGIGHELTFGTSAFRRVIDKRKFVNEYIGTTNIDEDAPSFTPTDKPLNARHRNLDSRQYGVFVTDRLRFNEHWQTILGGREVRLDEKAFDDNGDPARHTQQYVFLPQASLIYKPVEDISLYTTYSKGLSLGGTAPWFATNPGETLAPTVSRQIEAGVKYDWRRISFAAAVFQTRQAYQYAKPDDAGAFTYVQQGEQKNTGVELSANGWATERLQIATSVAAIRARVSGSGTAAYEDHQAINVPKLRASVYADYALPWVNGLALLGGVQYSAKKYANRTGNVEVGDYAVVNVGSRYSTRVDGYETVFRLSVDNLFDKRYWRDAGEYMGDDYLFQGAPLTARLSATVNF